MSTQAASKDSSEANVEGGERAEPVDAGPSRSEVREEVLDVRSMLTQLRRKWWLILIFVGFGIWSSITTIQQHSSAHQALMVVAPAQPQEQTQGQGRGLAGLAIGDQPKNDIFQRMRIIASTLKLARKLDEKHNLMMVVYGGGWDEENQAWRRPTGDRFEWDQKYKKFFNQTLWSEPTIEDLASYIGSSLVIDDIDNSDFYRISFAHSEAEMALWMLKIVYAEISELIRQQEIVEQANRREYLETRLEQTQVVEFRNALLGLLASVTRKEMMIQGDAPGEIVVFDPAYISKYKTSPAILRTFGIRVLGALGLSIGLILLWALFRAE